MAQEVVQRIAALAPELARESVTWMYGDPFWTARYGVERTRRFGDEDAAFHVTHLMRALDGQAPQMLATYAKWLRSVLVSRGMASLHLAENFGGLQRALAARSDEPGFDLAQRYLDVAMDALVYREGPGRALESVSETVLDACETQLGPGVRGELSLQLSYWKDAVAADRPELLSQHVRWYRGFFPARNLGAVTFDGVLDALVEAVTEALSGALAGWPLEVLRQAREEAANG